MPGFERAEATWIACAGFSDWDSLTRSTDPDAKARARSSSLLGVGVPASAIVVREPRIVRGGVYLRVMHDGPEHSGSHTGEITGCLIGNAENTLIRRGRMSESNSGVRREPMRRAREQKTRLDIDVRDNEISVGIVATVIRSIVANAELPSAYDKAHVRFESDGRFRALEIVADEVAVGGAGTRREPHSSRRRHSALRVRHTERSSAQQCHDESG